MTDAQALGYGATREEWAHFDMILGLTPDLLPVVSNPRAVISPDSRMKDKGKVPSKYDRKGHVVGINSWTSYVAGDVDMERWARNPDYGICIQTRRVRALDIDVPDQLLADEIRVFIELQLGINLPCRWRRNSGKVLLAFIIEGEMPKRVIRVREKEVDESGKVIQPAWLIEFLANGQQFVAAGTHSSGARIEWVHGLPYRLPVITVEQFDVLWQRLTEKFACAPSTVGALRKRGEYVETHDPLVELLVGKGLDLGVGNDGQIFIECPWKDNHSMDSGLTETAYFPRGTGGYELGHFKCLHAGCAHHKDEDYEQKLGLHDEMFEALPEVVQTNEKGEVVQPLPKWTRTKTGQVEASLHNLSLVLQRPDLLGRELKYDVFRNADMMRLPGGNWQPMTDGAMVSMRRHLERNLKFKSVSRELMRDAMVEHNEMHRFDSAMEWLEGLPAWDGEPRMEMFMHRCFGTEDTAYTRAVGRYLWTAMAGRVMCPGIKADMVPILQGEQGVIKSSAIAALVPSDELFTELSFGDKEDNLGRMMRGKLVVELGELRGFYTKEFEAIKAWIVKRKDEWVPKYRECAISAPRRVVMIGTTNHGEFLVDETGNRRFLPVRVTRADIKQTVKDRLQLWAEARDTFFASGIQWQDAEELARGEHEQFVVHDSWQDDIATWLNIPSIDGKKPSEMDYLRTSDVLREALNIDARSADSRSERRVAKVLKSLGYIRSQARVEGKSVKVFIKA